MAQNYNIELNRFNGTDYDVLHPVTTGENIVSGTINSDRLPTIPMSKLPELPVVAVAKGGTGATSADAARSNLVVPAKPVLLWGNGATWSSGSITVAKTGGSAGCTGLGNFSDYATFIIKTSYYTYFGQRLSMTKTSSECTFGGTFMYPDSGYTVELAAGSFTSSGNTLSSLRFRHYYRNADAGGTFVYGGDGSITAIYGLMLVDDIVKE